MTGTRAAAAAAFLTTCGWHEAQRTTIAGDASNRRYDRLRAADGTTAVLMDAPPEKGEDVLPFVAITQALRAQELSAPKLLAQDATHGFLLLEDLGDDLFARVVAEKPDLETTLYEAAVDVLVHLHAAGPPDLPPYDAATITPLAGLAYDWYAAGATDVTDTDAGAAFAETCRTVLTQFDAELDVLIQRDYHAENLLWLPHRRGIARVGLLDYQDAMRGHRAYDLVSILQDARRDVPEDLAARMIRHYTNAANVDAEAFAAAYACLGMQRNMRILGVFARLSLAYDKPHYVDLIPRVWNHLKTCLQHPSLATIKTQIEGSLPEPSETVLSTLKAKRGSVQL